MTRPNNRMERTALRVAADAERYLAKAKTAANANETRPDTSSS